MIKKKESFVLYYDWEPAFRRLNDAQKGQLIQAIFDYEVRGEAYTGDDLTVALAMDFIVPAIDRNNEQYRLVCERNHKNGVRHTASRARAGEPAAPEEPCGAADSEELCSHTQEPDTYEATPVEPSGFETQPAEPSGFGTQPAEPSGFKTKPAEPSGMDNDNDPESEYDPESEFDSESEYDPDFEADSEFDPESDSLSDREREPEGRGKPRTSRARRQDAAASGAPAFGEIEAFAKKAGLRADLSAFYDYYAARGWAIGGNPVRDWRALLRSWERREGQFQRPASSDSRTTGGRQQSRASVAPIPAQRRVRSDGTRRKSEAEEEAESRERAAYLESLIAEVSGTDAPHRGKIIPIREA